MNGDRTEKALSRIEAALARLDAVASRPAGANAELEARHEKLRSAVTQTLAQLDALIDGQNK